MASEPKSILFRPHSRVGVVGEYYPSALKQQLLLFDQLVVPGLDGIVRELRLLGTAGADDAFLGLANDLEFCEDQALILNPRPKEIFSKLAPDIPPEEGDSLLTAMSAVEEIEVSIRKITKEGKKKSGPLSNNELDLATEWFRRREFRQEVGSRIIARQLRFIHPVEASPILSSILGTFSSLANSAETKTVDVVSIVLNKLPMPDDSVPWEKIIDFREDAANKGYLQGLRVWMSEVSKQTRSEVELLEKLDWLLHQRQSHFATHKMAQNVGSFGAVFVASMEVVENLTKLKLAAAAKGIVSLFNRKVELLRWEANSPVPEINFIMRANRTFGIDN